MATDSAVATKNDGSSPWRIGGEAVAATVIAGLGVYQLVRLEKADAQAGLVLIGLAMLFWLLRGRTLGKFALTKDGVSAEFIDKVQTALDTATEAKQIAIQQVVPAGGRNIAEAALIGDDRWDHPSLQRGEAPDNDPQKRQWGEAAVRNGRRLRAAVRPVGEQLYEVVLIVEPVGEAPAITTDVRFHLHDSFPLPVRTVAPVNGRARLSVIAWGAFTVGAEVGDEPDTFLELDLSDPKYRFPEAFRSR